MGSSKGDKWCFGDYEGCFEAWTLCGSKFGTKWSCGYSGFKTRSNKSLVQSVGSYESRRTTKVGLQKLAKQGLFDKTKVTDMGFCENFAFVKAYRLKFCSGKSLGKRNL